MLTNFDRFASNIVLWLSVDIFRTTTIDTMEIGLVDMYFYFKQLLN